MSPREVLNSMKNKNTHNYETLEYLINHGKSGITSMEAFKELGVTRLSAVIFELKNIYNVLIESEKVTYTARNGRKVNFSRYYLKEDY